MPTKIKPASHGERYKEAVREQQKLEKNIKELTDQIAYLQKQMKNWQTDLVQAKNRVKDLSRYGQPTYVSDHAVLRYLERVDGIDVESVREKVRQAVSSHDGIYVSNGCRFVVNNNAVVTTLL